MVWTGAINDWGIKAKFRVAIKYGHPEFYTSCSVTLTKNLENRALATLIWKGRNKINGTTDDNTNPNTQNDTETLPENQPSESENVTSSEMTPEEYQQLLESLGYSTSGEGHTPTEEERERIANSLTPVN